MSILFIYPLYLDFLEVIEDRIERPNQTLFTIVSGTLRELRCVVCCISYVVYYQRVRG